MSFTNSDKKKVMADHGHHATDTGSVEVQVAMLTERINNLTGHFNSNAKDHHSKKGMMAIISRRKRLLAYLKGESYERYTALIGKLGIRK